MPYTATLVAWSIYACQTQEPKSCNYFNVLKSSDRNNIGIYRTFSNQGENAISFMNEEELALLGKVKLIRKGMSYREVIKILGYPTHEGEYEIEDSSTDWHVKNSYLHLNRISLYFGKKSEVKKITWRKYGYFTYEPDL